MQLCHCVPHGMRTEPNTLNGFLCAGRLGHDSVLGTERCRRMGSAAATSAAQVLQTSPVPSKKHLLALCMPFALLKKPASLALFELTTVWS